MPRRALLSASLGLALSQYLSRGMLLARGLAAAAALGPFGYGGWNALNLILDYGSYASSGALQGLDLRLPAAVARGEAVAARVLMAGTWWMVMAGGALFALALAAYLATGGAAFAVWPGPGLPLLMLAAALLQLAFQYLASVLRAHGRFHAVSQGYAVQAVVGAGLGLAAVWSAGPWGLVIGWLVGSAAALAWMRRAAPEAPLTPGRPAVGVEMARAGLPVFGYFVATLLLRSVDRLALVRFGSPEALGLYGLGLVAAGLVLYLPEAAAYVLFPRMAAAFQGAGDPAETRAESVRAHRALAVALPLAVAIGMVWVGPVVGRLLPAYAAGVPVLRVLAIGALMLAAATLPSYYLLAGAGRGRLLAIGVGAAATNAVLVFAVAARDPRPLPVAIAAAAGHTLFAATLVARVAGQWFASGRERWKHVAASLLPAAWAGGSVLAVCAVGPAEGWLAALWRSAAVALLYAPMLLGFGRRTGLATLARQWLAAR